MTAMTTVPADATTAVIATALTATVGTRPELAQALAELRRGGRSVALVPTMGALHEGHRMLFQQAHGFADGVVASVFVNPLQFGPGEDLNRYPRTLRSDVAAARAEGVAVVFAPSVATMYGDPPDAGGGDPPDVGGVTVHPGPLGDELEGAVRPGHFAGVLTVVAKLFNLVRPDVAVFGEKDYQQLVLIRRMVADLDLPVQVVGVPTVREPDGLARSSRNRYLTAEARRRALALSAALRAGAAAGRSGGAAALAAAGTVLSAAPGIDVDYLALRSVDLGPAPAAGPARLLVAARVGATRLIDNIAVTLAGADPAQN